MAIVQISQIQIRRGLQQDLPQLASAEMGWSLDTRKLYIGNGTLIEGAPTEGVTEILTQYSNFLSTIPNYTFTGTDSGFTSQTGASQLNPVNRTLQSVLDDIVTVRDFGAAGNYNPTTGLGTDDTLALNRAIQQIYKNSLNNPGTGEHANVRRAIKIPAGNYLVSSPIIVPPNCTLIGDGKNNTIITIVSGTAVVTGDANFLIGPSIGSTSGFPPSYIFISNMQFVTRGGINPVATVDSANNIVFDNVYFKGPSSVTNLVTTAASYTSTTAVTFNNCVFDGGTNGFAATATSRGIRIKNSSFLNNTTNGINVTAALSGLVSENNYFTSIPTAINNLSGNNYSYGDTLSGSTQIGGIYSGSAKFGAGQTVSLAIGTTNITQFSAGAGTMDYQLTDNAGTYRAGTMKYNSSNGTVYFDDEFTEPGTNALGANLFIDNTGNLSCTVTTTATFKYSIKQFV
jgi:hypothetical protein